MNGQEKITDEREILVKLHYWRHSQGLFYNTFKVYEDLKKKYVGIFAVK
jgi:hypothetical protein